MSLKYIRDIINKETEFEFSGWVVGFRAESRHFIEVNVGHGDTVLHVITDEDSGADDIRNNFPIDRAISGKIRQREYGKKGSFILTVGNNEIHGITFYIEARHKDTDAGYDTVIRQKNHGSSDRV